MDAAQPARVASRVSPIDRVQTARDTPLLAVSALSVRYPAGRGGGLLSRATPLPALDEIGFELNAGETLAVVGESGSGKSTLARALLGLQLLSGGSIRYRGRELSGLAARDWRPLRREIQMVFQDPAASFDPRLRIGAALNEPLLALCPELDASARLQRIVAAIQQVGLVRSDLQRYPQEFSGGQCQRLAIARALVVRPRLLVCDEVVSALDVSVQAQIVNLLRELQQQQGLALLFITHDLALVRHLADRVLVLYFGGLMEAAGKTQLYAQPRHPYTRALLAAVPESGIDQAWRACDGELPSTLHADNGCRFASRCAVAQSRCRVERPSLRRFADGGLAACHFAV